MTKVNLAASQIVGSATVVKLTTETGNRFSSLVRSIK